MYFKEVANRLVKHYGIPPEQHSAFLGRIKHLQRIGWPVGSNTGRGKQATYDERMYREILFTMELCAIGITPERSIEIAKANLPLLHSTAKAGGECTLHCPSSFGGDTPNTTIRVSLTTMQRREAA